MKREQELAERSKSEQLDVPGALITTPGEVAGSNNAIRKLFSRLRKRSIDSRCEQDPVNTTNRSNENVGLINSANSPCVKRDSTIMGGGIPQSTSAASTPTFNSKSKIFGIKSDNLGSNLALASSITKLNTICETEKSPSKSPLPHHLPRVNDAQSVRQKWIILLTICRYPPHT